MLKFCEVPFGDLGDNVVERGLEAGGGRFGNCVGEFWESVAKSDFGSGVCEGVARSFGCEGTKRVKCESFARSPRSTETSIHLDDSVIPTVWV